MKSLKYIGTLLLWVAFVAVAAYGWQTRYVPCAEPIEYRLGTVDPRFKLSDEEVLRDIAKASDLWGTARGRPLFAYNPEGALTINLIYDTRQQATQKTAELSGVIDKTSRVASSVKAQYSSLQSSYNAADAEYERQVAQFNEAQGAYNERVEYWNAKGGAPPAEYAKLSAQKRSLTQQLSSIEAKRQELNRLADQINALIDKYNLLVDHINANVDDINNNGLVGTEFEEGVYVSDASGERIDIYEFESKTAFLRVLAHELGHALGLDHTEGPDSIMNPVNRGKTFALTAQDREALEAECKE
ncbi:MAG TPA: matrixin family metalloprotease [Candidatus Paceibacterota bacterium]